MENPYVLNTSKVVRLICQYINYQEILTKVPQMIFKGKIS